MNKDQNNEYLSLNERWKLDKIDFRDGMATQCFFCKHIRPKKTCKAFPEGIPEEIYNNLFIHKIHYDGDHGILFEPDKAEYDNIVFKPLRE